MPPAGGVEAKGEEGPGELGGAGVKGRDECDVIVSCSDPPFCLRDNPVSWLRAILIQLQLDDGTRESETSCYST